MESKLKVKLLSYTPEPDKLVTSAAKLCYSKVGVEEIQENLTEEKVEKFIDKLMSMGHESPIEHVTFTFGVEGVSRVLSHQLVRHRIGSSYSQQSQRYVKLDQFEYIIPPAIAKNKIANHIFWSAMKEDQIAYNEIVDELMKEKINGFISDRVGVRESLWDYNSQINYMKKYFKEELNSIKKQAIEDARYVFPNACETKIIFTMNARALFNFFKHRCCNRAQWEIRELADKMLEEVKNVSQNVFKYAGAPCTYGSCPEGKMTCGNPRKE